MTVQLALLGDPVTITPDGTPLTPRQQHVLDYIAASPDGRDAAEIGAMLHELRGAHRPGFERCRWCAEEGLGVLRSARLRPLLIRRRTGMWQLREPLGEREEGQDVNLARAAGIHDHEAVRDDGTPAACPAAGCSHGRDRSGEQIGQAA